MIRDKQHYKVLVVEDNLADFVLIEDYLNEKFLSIEILRAINFKELKRILADTTDFQVLLLDLSLPDKEGAYLINETLSVVTDVPVIALTGYSDISFAIKSLSLGISDFLLKDELSAASLYKSIVYNIERNKTLLHLRESEQKYLELFHLSPQPMWVYDLDTLRFLDVNDAAIAHYGYSREEFLGMNIKDIRPEEEIPRLERAVQFLRSHNTAVEYREVVHKKKDGTIIYVDIKSNSLHFNGKNAQIALASDITDFLKHTKAVELQNKRLREIAWLQSHVVRAPLARMLSLVDVMTTVDLTEEEKAEFLKNIVSSAKELDLIITDIISKSKQVNDF